MKEGPRLPPLSVPEVNRALDKPQLAQWMRLMLSNIKPYVRLRAGEVGEIPRPSEFGGQATEAAVDPGEQLAWRVWDCVSQSQAAYARRYAGTHGKSSSESSQYTTREEAWKDQGSAFAWRSVKFREVGGVLQWQTRQGEWILVDSPPSGGCQRSWAYSPYLPLERESKWERERGASEKRRYALVCMSNHPDLTSNHLQSF